MGLRRFFLYRIGILAFSGLSCTFNPQLKDLQDSNQQKESEFQYESKRAIRAQQNAELLSELYRVVFLHPPQNRQTFGTLLDSLNQGASLEGIYNGFTHSSYYRDLESKPYKTSRDLVNIFVQEVVQIQWEMKDPKLFTPEDALPLPCVTAQLEDCSPRYDLVKPKILLNGNLKKHSRTEVEKYYQDLFKKASIFTMKRLLGHEVLLLVQEKQKNRDVLANWYANWAVVALRYGVDFGLGLRNNDSRNFHQKWAKEADLDRLKWELLNRCHRILNQMDKR